MVEEEIAMLAMSDVQLDQFLHYFADTGAPVAFLVPTPTGYGKSIMDATGPVRELLLNTGVHDYESQGQGPENKVTITAHFVTESGELETSASLYRPVTKKGDPRIWFSNLKRYCNPCNLLALVVINREIYIINLSNEVIVRALQDHAFPYSVIEEAGRKDESVAEELLARLNAIHREGFLRSITPGDPGVGDTLEHALGISRNNSKSPDYNGIELKASRLTRNGKERHQTRSTLFTRVPDAGMSYREIVENYGKIQIPKGKTEARLQLYETFRCSRTNAYDMMLSVDADKDQLDLLYQKEQLRKFVSLWYMDNLKAALMTKHRETFWVKAVSEPHDGVEYFRYDKVLHTKRPNASLVAPLLAADKITVDLAAHIDPSTGKWRDHGVLFKMQPDDLPLLLGEPRTYILQ